jgi:lysylphosphatidylglycerol synthetase-like protein (DUF2156 family)
MNVRSSGSLAPSQPRERLALVLRQKRTPSAVMAGILLIALLLGLIGLAVHVLWVAAIIMMALGLGFTLANSRRDRIDVVNERASDQADDQIASGQS